MRPLDSDVLRLLSTGGNDITDALRDAADDAPCEIEPELTEAIGKLIVGGASAKKLAKLLDAPASTISARMRRNRRQIAMILSEGIGKKLVESTAQYYTIMKRVMDEVQRRVEDPMTLESMPNKELVQLLMTAQKWIIPSARSLVLDPSRDEQFDNHTREAPPVTIQAVMVLLDEADRVRRRQPLQEIELGETDSPPTNPEEQSSILGEFLRDAGTQPPK
jgi:hypothetical protein